MIINVTVRYYEIQDEDYTAVAVQLVDPASHQYVTLTNFDPDEIYSEGFDEDNIRIHLNQTETFTLPDMDTAKAFYASNSNYTIRDRETLARWEEADFIDLYRDWDLEDE